MSIRLTIVFGYRNREAKRVKRCLDSLMNQSDQNFNVIFVDYGSDLDCAKEIKELVSSYSFCTYVYNDSRGMPWNRAHALNSGIRLSEGEFTMTSDIDLIYTKDFVKDVLLNVDEGVELHANAYALPRKFKKWEYLSGSNKLSFPQRNLTALGLVQVVSTEILRSIRGFDEYYRIWGAEDEDLNQRLYRKGLVTRWLDIKKTPVFHQWHPSSGVRAKKNIPNGWQKNLGHYLKENEGNLVRNLSREWGKIISSESRIIFSCKENTKRVSKLLKLNDVPTFQSINLIYKNFFELGAGDVLKVEYEDVRLPALRKSFLCKLINKFNDLSNAYNWPLLLTNDLSYFGNYESTYDFMNMIMFFILNNESIIEDYFIEHREDLFEILLLKK